MPYNRRTGVGHRQATKDGRSGILSEVRPRGAVRPHGTAEDAGTGTGVRADGADIPSGERKRHGHREGPGRE